MIVLLVGAFVVLASSFVLKFFQTVQNAPYMDEVFHIPQAQQFCAYNFSSWDPMITTLPGLYLFSLVQLLPVAIFHGVPLTEVCTTLNLRATNMTYCCGNFFLLYILSKQLAENTKVNMGTHFQQILHATVFLLFPVQCFFTWLYYTDPGSTFFTLLMYALCLRGHHKSSAVVSVAAVLFRQTNIVWVLFCIGIGIIEIIYQQYQTDKKGDPRNIDDVEVLKHILQTATSSPGRLFRLIVEVLKRTFCYICVIIGFIVFVVLNGGIVVGDRTHHHASYNFPQVFIFLSISAAFSFLHLSHPRQILSFLQAAVRNPLKVLLFVVCAGFIIRFFTYEHIYLLSDNRHYTFYVWSKIYRRHHLAKYAMVPVYMFSLYQFYKQTDHKGMLWKLLFSFCTVACLVPQALLEFRYYIIPFYVLRLNMKLPTLKLLVAELLLYVAINVFTAYIFVKRPFYWPGNPNPQRIMW